MACNMEEQTKKRMKKRNRMGIVLLCLALIGLLLAGLFLADRNTRSLGFDLETHLLQTTQDGEDRLYATFYFMGTSLSFDYTGFYHAASWVADVVWPALEQVGEMVQACLSAGNS